MVGHGVEEVAIEIGDDARKLAGVHGQIDVLTVRVAFRGVVDDGDGLGVDVHPRQAGLDAQDLRLRDADGDRI